MVKKGQIIQFVGAAVFISALFFGRIMFFLGVLIILIGFLMSSHFGVSLLTKTTKPLVRIQQILNFLGFGLLLLGFLERNLAFLVLAGALLLLDLILYTYLYYTDDEFRGS